MAKLPVWHSGSGLKKFGHCTFVGGCIIHVLLIEPLPDASIGMGHYMIRAMVMYSYYSLFLLYACIYVRRSILIFSVLMPMKVFIYLIGGLKRFVELFLSSHAS